MLVGACKSADNSNGLQTVAVNCIAQEACRKHEQQLAGMQCAAQQQLLHRCGNYYR
jgi:hypothetical protein